VSTAEQVDGASLDAQRVALTAEAEQRGWELELVVDAGMSAKTLDRPALTAALERLDAGTADHLLAVRLDRLSRSVADFAPLMQRAQRSGWGIVVLDPAIDITTSAGEFMAHMLISVAQFERRLNGDRTRAGMAQRKAEGVHVGRPVTMSADVIARILEAHKRGDGWSAIARQLNDDQVPTARGGRVWHPSTVRQVVVTAGLLDG